MNLKWIGTTSTTRGRSPEDHKLNRIANDEGVSQSPTYSRDLLVDNDYHMTRIKSKSDISLLKMDSGETLFANAYVNVTHFKFPIDSGASKVSCLRNGSCQF